jgi:hypothetical protein
MQSFAMISLIITLWSSVLGDQLLLIAFCSGSSWSAAVRQIHDDPVAIFEVFRPVLLTADTHAVFCMDRTKSIGVFAAESSMSNSVTAC